MYVCMYVCMYFMQSMIAVLSRRFEKPLYDRLPLAEASPFWCSWLFFFALGLNTRHSMFFLFELCCVVGGDTKPSSTMKLVVPCVQDA